MLGEVSRAWTAVRLGWRSVLVRSVDWVEWVLGGGGVDAVFDDGGVIVVGGFFALLLGFFVQDLEVFEEVGGGVGCGRGGGDVGACEVDFH